MQKVVIDIETQNTFEEAGSYDPAALKISVVVAYEYATDTYHTYLESELPRLWKLLENVDLLIGFNLDHFDVPILNKYYPGDLTKIKTLDLLTEIKNSLGRRVSLDSVASGTLGAKKSAHGLQAITWWKQGEIEKIKRYCQDDVRLTKEIYEFALKNKFLRYKFSTETGEVKLNTDGWDVKADNAINYTLPF